MNARDGTTAFLPLDSRIGGQGRDDSPTVGQFLTREQTRYIYRKVETGEIIHTDTIEQEIEQEKQLNKIDDTNGETNPYHHHRHHQILSALSRLNVMDLHFFLFSAFLTHSL